MSNNTNVILNNIKNLLESQPYSKITVVMNNKDGTLISEKFEGVQIMWYLKSIEKTESGDYLIQIYSNTPQNLQQMAISYGLLYENKQPVIFEYLIKKSDLSVNNTGFPNFIYCKSSDYEKSTQLRGDKKLNDESRLNIKELKKTLINKFGKATKYRRYQYKNVEQEQQPLESWTINKIEKKNGILKVYKKENNKNSEGKLVGKLEGRKMIKISNQTNINNNTIKKYNYRNKARMNQDIEKLQINIKYIMDKKEKNNIKRIDKKCNKKCKEYNIRCKNEEEKCKRDGRIERSYENSIINYIKRKYPVYNEYSQNYKNYELLSVDKIEYIHSENVVRIFFDKKKIRECNSKIEELQKIPNYNQKYRSEWITMVKQIKNIYEKLPEYIDVPLNQISNGSTNINQYSSTPITHYNYLSKEEYELSKNSGNTTQSVGGKKKNVIKKVTSKKKVSIKKGKKRV